MGVASCERPNALACYAPGRMCVSTARTRSIRKSALQGKAAWHFAADATAAYCCPYERTHPCGRLGAFANVASIGFGIFGIVGALYGISGALGIRDDVALAQTFDDWVRCSFKLTQRVSGSHD